MRFVVFLTQWMFALSISFDFSSLVTPIAAGKRIAFHPHIESMSAFQFQNEINTNKSKRFQKNKIKRKVEQIQFRSFITLLFFREFYAFGNKICTQNS